MFRRFVLAQFLALFSLYAMCLMQTAHAQSKNREVTYTVHIVPQYNVVQLHNEWTPLLERLSRETGIKLQLVLSSSIPKFEHLLLKGEPDFALVNPYHAVMAKAEQGYLPLLRDTKALTGILVVRRDSPYKTLQDLTGKDIGFPAPNAFGASLYMRALLADAKVIYNAQILNTHGNVYRNVVNGGVAAGGGVNNTFNDETTEIKSQLRILYQTPGSASHPLVVHSRVPEKVQQAIKAAFLALQRDPEGIAMLKDVRLPNVVSSNYDADYLPLEKLKVEKFLILEKE